MQTVLSTCVYDIEQVLKNSLHCKTLTIFIGEISNGNFLVDDQQSGQDYVRRQRKYLWGPLGASHDSLPDVSKISSYGLHPITSIVQLSSPPAQ